jgi:hypothetical protein
MPDDTGPQSTSNSGDIPGDAPGVGDNTQALSADELANALAAEDATSPAVADTTTQAVQGVATPAGGAAGEDLAIGNTPSTRAQHRRRRSSINRRWVVVLIAAAVAVAGSGVALAVSKTGGHDKPNADSPNIPAVTTTAPSGPVCPLTALPAPGGQVPQRPALAVKVDNYPQARPQSGLDQADMVFEEPVEGGITRLVPVFQCQSPALIGPVRSARAVDVQILGELGKPAFVHAGGIDPVLALVNAAKLTNVDVLKQGSIVQNPSGRYAPYDTYISAAAAWGLDPSNTSPPAPLFSYSPTTPAGTAVTTLHIPFSSTNNTRWTWDASSGKWQLSYGSTPATIANGGQITTSNIVVQTVRVTYGPWAENSVGGLEVQSQMTGSGPLMVLRNGIAVSGTWHRASVSDPTILTDSNGSPIALQPGPTWIEIVPSTVTVSTTQPPAAP